MVADMVADMVNGMLITAIKSRDRRSVPITKQCIMKANKGISWCWVSIRTHCSLKTNSLTMTTCSDCMDEYTNFNTPFLLAFDEFMTGR